MNARHRALNGSTTDEERWGGEVEVLTDAGGAAAVQTNVEFVPLYAPTRAYKLRHPFRTALGKNPHLA